MRNSPIKTWRSATKRSEDRNPLKVQKVVIGKGLTMNEMPTPVNAPNKPDLNPDFTFESP